MSFILCAASLCRETQDLANRAWFPCRRTGGQRAGGFQLYVLLDYLKPMCLSHACITFSIKKATSGIGFIKI